MDKKNVGNLDEFDDEEDFMDENDEILEDEKLAEDWGFGPNDFEKTMGLDQAPDWFESFDLDGFGEGD